MNLRRFPLQQFAMLVYLLFFSIQHLSYSLYTSSFILPFIYMVIVGGLVWSNKKILIQKYYFLFKILLICICLLFVNYIMHVGTSGLGLFIVLPTLFLQLLFICSAKFSYSALRSFSIYFFVFGLIYTIVDKGEFNTNTIGFVFFVIGVYTTILLENKSLKHLFLLVLVSICILYFISLSDSRTCLVCFLFYLLLRFVPSKLLVNRYFYWGSVFFLTLGSLIYVQFYIFNFLNRDVDLSEYFSFSNKNIYSGRELIWIEALALWGKAPFTGTGSNVHLESFGAVNLHNSILNLLVIYGLPIFSLFLYALFKVLATIKNIVGKDYIAKNSFVAFLAFLLIGFSETSLFVEMFASFLVLAIAMSRVYYKY